jgi:hypothetical protein
MSEDVSSVTQASVDRMPEERSFTFGAGPSKSTIALPPALCPVTTRRVAFMISPFQSHGLIG